MAKQYSITRIARGKVETNVDKEFDNVTKQVEDKFNGMLNKLNAFDIRNITEKRTADLDSRTITLLDSLNLFATLVKDLKDILSTK